MKQTAVLRLSDLIDAQPVSRFQVLVATLCGLIVFVDGFDAQAMGYVAQPLMEELKISRVVLGPVISAGLVGMMLGALVSGVLADRLGRKPILIGSAFVFGVGSLLTAGAASVEQLVIYRVLTGLGMGGAMPNAIALTSEYMPEKFRATSVTLMMCGFSLGAAVGGWFAAALIPTFGWRSVFVAGGAFPCVIGAASLVWLPESIRFLLATDRGSARAATLLARMSPPGARVPPVSAGVDHPSAGGIRTVYELFTDRRALSTLLIWVLYFMNLLNLYLLNNWLPTILSDAGIDRETAIMITTLFQVGGIAGAIVLGRLLDYRRSFFVLAMCFLAAAVFILLIGEVGASVPLLVLTVFFAGVGVIGGQNGSHAMTADFYPTTIRSTGVGWALGIGRIGSIVGPIIGGYLLTEGGGASHVFWSAAVPAVLTMVAAAGLHVLQPSRQVR